jgi:hypothetical protein
MIHSVSHLLHRNQNKLANACRAIILPILIGLLLNVGSSCNAQDFPAPDLSVFTPVEWKHVDNGVDRGLAWLAAQQLPDGSFPTFENGKPAVTSLTVMAFLSRGHVVGFGPYGKKLERAIDFVINQQQPEGLVFAGSLHAEPFDSNEGTHTSMYNHAISGLMLGEVYGMTDGARAKKIHKVIESALGFARGKQLRRSKYDKDHFAWRYYKPINRPGIGESDMSVTGWFLMFYRSSKNAEFDIPQEFNNDAIKFVRNCYDENDGSFGYAVLHARKSRAMTGAGLLSYIVTGNYEKKITANAQQWIVKHPFDRYNSGSGSHDRYHYGAYYCSQAMFMLGGEPWKQFYKPLATTMLANQSVEGAWQPERAQNDGLYGPCYTTALSILSLTPPYQMLPIYQR